MIFGTTGNPLHVGIASPEIAPFAKTGGLADVLGSLPKALQRLGVQLTLIMPAYRTVLRSGLPLENTGVQITVPISNRKEEGTLLEIKTDNVIPIYFIRADQYFDRDHLYDDSGVDYPDNAERFIFFARAILEVLRRNPVEILHVHDWQSALAIVFLKAQPQLYPELLPAKAVLTIHNMGHQGLFWYLDWHLLNLPRTFFNARFLEFHGRINFLKGAIALADFITTVSPTYADEITTHDQGFGLEGILQERAASLIGILNGVDYDIWNPETDPDIHTRYGLKNLAGKKGCKADLQRTFGLPEALDVPIIGMVSRLAAQKGLDLLEKSLDELLCRNIQFILLGKGDRHFEGFFKSVPLKYPRKAGVRIVFDESLARKVISGSDFFLMPSRYEPGGLTQLLSLRYGTIPVVRSTGGLRDTIEEFDPQTGKGNGFVFHNYGIDDFLAAVDRALAAFSQKENWHTLMVNAMTSDFSWSRSAQEYLKLYQKLIRS